MGLVLLGAAFTPPWCTPPPFQKSLAEPWGLGFRVKRLGCSWITGICLSRTLHESVGLQVLYALQL